MAIKAEQSVRQLLCLARFCLRICSCMTQFTLSFDVASWSDIIPCVKIDITTSEIHMALTRENPSSVFPTRSYPNQPAELQRLARELKFHLFKV